MGFGRPYSCPMDSSTKAGPTDEQPMGTPAMSGAQRAQHEGASGSHRLEEAELLDRLRTFVEQQGMCMILSTSLAACMQACAKPAAARVSSSQSAQGCHPACSDSIMCMVRQSHPHDASRTADFQVHARRMPCASVATLHMVCPEWPKSMPCMCQWHTLADSITSSDGCQLAQVAHGRRAGVWRSGSKQAARRKAPGTQ